MLWTFYTSNIYKIIQFDGRKFEITRTVTSIVDNIQNVKPSGYIWPLKSCAFAPFELCKVLNNVYLEIKKMKVQ